MKTLFRCLVFVFLPGALFAQTTLTWGTVQDVTSASYSNFRPRISIDRAGNPLVIWTRMSDDAVFFSRWNGSAFSTPLKLNPAGYQFAGSFWMGPDIAAHGDTLYVVMKRKPEASDTNHVYLIRSTDGGMSFSPIYQVDTIADSISRFPAVTTDAGGNPIVGFMKFDNSFGDPRWVISRSTDLGSTWSKDVKASGWGGMNAKVCDCCPGAVVSNNNQVFMLYRAEISNIRDTWAGYSSNSGASFSAGWNIDQHNWSLFSCPSTGPDGLALGDSLISVFMSGAGGNDRVYKSTMSLSNPGTANITPLTGSISGLVSQNYPRVAAYGNAMAITWKQSVNGVDQLPLLFAADGTTGLFNPLELADSEDITNADIAMAEGKVYLVWEDDNSGTVRFRSASFSQAVSVAPRERNPYLRIYPSAAHAGILHAECGLPFSQMELLDSKGLCLSRLEFSPCLEKDWQLPETVASGIYLLRVLTQEGFVSQRVCMIR